MSELQPIVRPAHVPTIGSNGNRRPRPLTDYRCGQCGRMLFRARIYSAIVEVRCPKCKRFNVFEALAELDAEPIT